MSSGYRSLESFGVAGLLDASAEVFYSSLFSTHHLGRVSDLLSARLKKSEVIELWLRTSLVLCVFQGYQTQLQKNSDRLKEPLTLECGLDGDRLVVGVAFNLGLSTILNTEGMSGRISKNNFLGPFEQLLAEIYKQSDDVIVRFQPETRRTEICAVLFIKKDSKKAEKEKKPLEMVEIPLNERPVPKPKSYTHLGDLNYSKLLEPDPRETEIETLQKQIVQEESSETVQEDEIVVSEKPNEETDDSIRVQGGGTSTQNEDVIVVGSGDYEKKGSLKAVDPKLKKRSPRIKGFFKKLLEKKPKPESEKMTVSGEGTATDEDDLLLIQADQPHEVEVAQIAEEIAKLDENELISVISSENSELFLERVKREGIEVKRQTEDQGVSKWVDGIVHDLVVERARLNEVAKKLGQSLKVKENDYKNKTAYLEEEIRRKDIQLNQKDMVLDRNREQMNQMNRNMDRLKTLTQDVVEDGRFKQKYSSAQRMLALAKEENAQLNKKIDALKTQLSSAKSATIGSGPEVSDVAALQSKYERVYRQAEEFKKANRQLIEHINEIRRDRVTNTAPAMNHDETGRRLEAAMRIMANTRKENDSLKNRVQSLQTQEVQLKLEITQLQAELKAHLEKKNNAA